MHHKLSMISLYDIKGTDQRNKAIYDVIGAVLGSNQNVPDFLNYTTLRSTQVGKCMSLSAIFFTSKACSVAEQTIIWVINILVR